MKNLHIKNGKIYTMTDAGIIENGEILIENGKITSVGTNLIISPGIKTLDAAGGFVLPGFIDAHCHAGIFEAGLGVEGNDGNETSDPVTPELRGIDGINPLCESFRDGLEAGITTVATGPGSANSFGGQFAALKTHGTTIREMVIREPLAMKCAFGENPKRVYGSAKKAPVTRMANAALIRKNLALAAEYTAKKDLAESRDDDSLRPSFDQKLEALEMVIRCQIPLKAHAHRADDMLTALRIADEFNIDITLDHCTEGHLIVDELVEAGKGLIVGPSFMFKSKPEVKNLTFKTPGILASAGIKVAIMTDLPCSPLSFLPVAVGLAIKAGMHEMDGFKSITSSAAEILGIQDRVGSLEPGKDGDVIIYDSHPFLNILSNCQYTIVNGEVVYSKTE
ncbi:MAG: amidohydrolase [Bacteroidetes bacterium]|nr:amidohydrolase [Bacteroidota bacterium]